MDALIAAHPLKQKPYSALVFVRCDRNRVPLYRVEGSKDDPRKAKDALGRAFELHGGECFYCRKKFAPQPLSPRGPQRDHVVASSSGGSDLLHNLVIACEHCGRTKSADPIHLFRPRSAIRYFEALEAHIAQCVREAS